MRPEKRNKQQGVALLMVLIALIILGSMTADLLETNETYLATTVNARDSLRAEYMAKSGVNLSRLLLSFQKIFGRSMNFPFWQYADLVVGIFTGEEGGGMLGDLAGLDLSGAEGLGLGIEDSDLKVTVIAEDSKLNVNVANDQVLGDGRQRMVNQLMALMSPPDYDHIFDREAKGGQYFERQDVICEMIDWTDADGDLCDMTGSEDPSFYHMLDPPYERKNAPLDSIQELHLVKGIDDDFWSAFVEPNPEDPTSRIFTIWGRGRVNVNTAPPAVLYTLICMMATDQNGVSACGNPEMQMNLLRILEGIKLFRQFLPFKNAKEFITTIQNPASRFIPVPGFPLDARMTSGARRIFKADSSVFSIYADGTVGKVTKRIHLVVDMKSEDMVMLDPENSVGAAGGKVLYWRME